jgi:tetratricopeptide (TPR) repeat protein
MKASLLAVLAIALLAPQDARKLWERALDQEAAGDHQGALEDLNKALELDPDHFRVLLTRSMVKESLEDYEGAYADATRAAGLGPRSAEARAVAGSAAFLLEKFAEANDWYTQALQFDPDRAPLYLFRARARYGLGDYDGCFADCARVDSRRPGDPQALFQRASGLMATGRWTAAIEHFLEYLKSSDTAWRNEAEVLIGVLPDFPNDGSPLSPASRLFAKAKAAFGEGNVQRASVLAEEVLRMDHANLDAHGLLAQIWFRTSRNRAMLHLYRWTDRGQEMPPDLRELMKKGASSVLAGLIWLNEHQSPDGRWSSTTFGDSCPQRGTPEACSGSGSVSDLRATSYAVLAFLGAGYSPLSRENYSIKPFPATVKDAVAWLMMQPDAGDVTDHAIMTLALSEIAGMTAILEYQAPAQRAVDQLISLRLAGSGWPATVAAREPDERATGWALVALKSAKLSEFKFPEDAVLSGVDWLMQSKATVPIAATGALFHKRKDYRDAALAAGRDEATRPLEEAVDKQDAVMAFFRTQTVAWGAKEAWKAWTIPSRAALLKRQGMPSDRCRSGSWFPQSKTDLALGPVALTALHAMTLEVHYGYANNIGGVR